MGKVGPRVNKQGPRRFVRSHRSRYRLVSKSALKFSEFFPVPTYRSVCPALSRKHIQIQSIPMYRVPLIWINSTLRLHSTRSHQAKQVHRLLSSFFASSVEWIDAMIMDGGIWLCTHLHRDSHAQAGGSGGGRCGEGGGVNYLASNFSYLNDCMEAVPQTQQ